MPMSMEVTSEPDTQRSVVYHAREVPVPPGACCVMCVASRQCGRPNYRDNRDNRDASDNRDDRDNCLRFADPAEAAWGLDDWMLG